jgi:hypothetical protein
MSTQRSWMPKSRQKLGFRYSGSMTSRPSTSPLLTPQRLLQSDDDPKSGRGKKASLFERPTLHSSCFHFPIREQHFKCSDLKSLIKLHGPHSSNFIECSTDVFYFKNFAISQGHNGNRSTPWLVIRDNRKA